MNPLFTFQTAHYYREQLLNRYDQNQINPNLQQSLEAVMSNADNFDKADFMQFEMKEIFDYLKLSHQYYLDVWIPKLENTLAQLHAKLRKDYWSINLLTLSLNAYKKELVLHIEQEEKVLFAFVEKLLSGQECEGLKDLVLNHFIQTHDDNVILEINNLKREVLSIDAELEGNLIVEVLFNQLEIFQADLKVHGLIEDEVFLQKVIEQAN